MCQSDSYGNRGRAVWDGGRTVDDWLGWGGLGGAGDWVLVVHDRGAAGLDWLLRGRGRAGGWVLVVDGSGAGGVGLLHGGGRAASWVLVVSRGGAGGWLDRAGAGDGPGIGGDKGSSSGEEDCVTHLD